MILSYHTGGGEGMSDSHYRITKMNGSIKVLEI